LQEIDRLEAGDHDRRAVAIGEPLVRARADDGADVSGAEKRLHAVVGRLEDGGHRGGNEHVGREQPEVLELEPLREQERHRIGRRRGFEADAEEDDFLARVLLGQVDGVER
jgi:hypothetical protein